MSYRTAINFPNISDIITPREFSSWSNLHWFLTTLGIYLWTFIILLIQDRYGALFFLPDSYRTMLFKQCLRTVDFKEAQENLFWNLCLNSLTESELCYYGEERIQNLGKIFKKHNYPIGTYIRTPWNHEFHPNWILFQQINSNLCPIWDSSISLLKYTDCEYSS